MTLATEPDAAAATPVAGPHIIKLAILAVGGQGGGVLSDWIVQAAEQSGYAVQTTSVPGVAQRTGATIYSIEMTPRTERLPVLALMPSPGDVDIVVAAELMEAGRAVMRGLVTPERTTLIASTHRMLAVSEKIVAGNGIADGEAVLATVRSAARRFVGFDMDRIAAEAGTMISASLFGALAGCGALPFERAAFENAIRKGGRGVEASLAAFARAYDRARHADAADAAAEAPASPERRAPSGPQALVARWQALAARAAAFPPAVCDMTMRGLEKVVDFQDLAYGEEYLDRLDAVLRVDGETGGAARDWALSMAAAKHVANAMAYDDVIRVADRKTRAARFARIAREVEAPADAVVQLTEYMHPRGAEVCSMLPAELGRAIEARPRLFALLDRVVNRGRRVRSDSLVWFTVLFGLAGLRRWRRRLLRHQREVAHVDEWLAGALATARRNYPLAVEIVLCRRLIKGYSDTHERGLSKFDRVLGAVPLLVAREDGADWLRRLREAALKDEAGSALDGALRTVHSFAGDGAALAAEEKAD
ncbi:indolepyruvate oxidoreductase subunit beta family protein [Aquibium sp. A9E412]|uniref:indolepyruvate oxidoreductase subunit beta family protein n=1 Tax=Aquibium sp. A9E412 TaxID=2976767 RepID=UPI0025B03A7B|nr:indolepyruvate oxidoreductase subunit beta family protein [Aquibium sp. A9E412]MDN2567291.1 indolepyruvate oxidoreductase subunit beta family protein [Aquibium sp. A9E412]